jgi:hypothetical protein
VAWSAEVKAGCELHHALPSTFGSAVGLLEFERIISPFLCSLCSASVSAAYRLDFVFGALANVETTLGLVASGALKPVILAWALRYHDLGGLNHSSA